MSRRKNKGIKRKLPVMKTGKLLYYLWYLPSPSRSKWMVDVMGEVEERKLLECLHYYDFPTHWAWKQQWLWQHPFREIKEVMKAVWSETAPPGWRGIK